MSSVKEFWVDKFGGTSLANAQQIMKVRDIVFADERRKIVVVSAPGKEHKEDTKITDLLLSCHRLIDQGQPFDELFSVVRKRILAIAEALNVDQKKMEKELDGIYAQLPKEKSANYAGSRGEYLNAIMIAEAFNATFVDSAEIIFLTDKGQVDEKSYDKVAQRLGKIEGRIVVPGFYGTGEDGSVKTFSRGGSDISGAILAKALKATKYENWTDVSGIYVADPRFAVNAGPVANITYSEIRELATIGASVLHEDAIAPVRSANIPINVRNTNDPTADGTIISETRDIKLANLVGVSGKKPYRKVVLEKYMLNRDNSAKKAISNFLEHNNYIVDVVIEAFDTMTLFIYGELDEKDLKLINDELLKSVETCTISDELVLIGVVGEGLANEKELVKRVSNKVDVPFEIISELSPIKMVLSFALEDYNTALNALVDLVVGK